MIFLATPITGLLDEDYSFPREMQTRLEHVIATLEQRFSDRVFCAIRDERWGAAIALGQTCTPRDFAAMQKSETVIAFPGDSFGVHVELGWASALGKRIYLVVDSNNLKSPLIEGLQEIADVHFCFIDEELFPSQKTWDEQVLPLIGQHLPVS